MYFFYFFAVNGSGFKFCIFVQIPSHMLICVFVTVEDVSDLWLNVKESFEQRVPVKKACLNNKARNPVFVDNLPAEFIQTTDSRLRSRFPQEQYLFWFREPYATVVLVTCEVLPTHITPLSYVC
jgi:hypothetical protein